MNCPECSQQISEMAQTCPHCGCNVKQAQKNKQQEQVQVEFANMPSEGKKTNNITAVIVIGLIIALLFGAIKCCGSFSSSDSREIDAWVCAQNVVRNNLKSPSSADFCSYPEATIIDLGDDQYMIKGYVDAQNSFGAMVRSYFTVTLTLTKNGYEDARCSIG